MTKKLEQVLRYHQATKHQPGRFARGPRHLDWATQPDPFRRYHGARLVELERVLPGVQPGYDLAFFEGHLPPEPLNLGTVSQLFFYSLALSAWKRAGDVTWSLRVNPSSGNLHPTEGYLVCGPIHRLTERPMVAHYAPREHALEIRAEFPLETWQTLTTSLPASLVLIGLSSIHWREAWKYGERSFRYCQHDVGHAIAAISLAAASLGWQATLLDDLGTDHLSRLLGISDAQGAQMEHPDCLLAVYPQGQGRPVIRLDERSLADFTHLPWQGQANQPSPSHVHWPIIDEVAAATEKLPTEGVYRRTDPSVRRPGNDTLDWLAAQKRQGLCQIIRQRRSAVAMDGHGSIGRDVFYGILRKVLAGPGQFPFNTLSWPLMVHLAIFVHRVKGLEPGLYMLVREPAQKRALKAAMKADLAWEKAPGCPPSVHLFRLVAGDARATARQLSCQQAIASDGCFSLGMIARFKESLEHFGPWFYRRLFWECGMVGQVLYLEAEAAGVRGTGIGCFFDDSMHQLLGLETAQYQSLYHFTVGHPVEDTRLTTLPAYS